MVDCFRKKLFEINLRTQLTENQSLGPKKHLNLPTEHSENKTTTKLGLSGNEIGPGVLQFNVQLTRTLQKCRKLKA